jgi:demethylmenaquinone methyltransferase/2-methoxy-6-polyprenyl-1,4-benzoquinol methylase
MPVAPCPPLVEERRSEAERRRFVGDLFDASAADYDRICRLMAFGFGQRYRRDALRRAGVAPGMRVLDVATGTGLVAREALALTERRGTVVGVDPSAGMLREARQVGYLSVRGFGEALPFASGAFDFLSMGYALRHLSDLGTAFAEYRRVLRPGGRLLVLEITAPASGLRRWLTRQYMQRVVPRLARAATRRATGGQLMEYYWDTIARCVPPATILDALAASGFAGVHRHVVHGIFSEYTARR